jgi:hypothetical protein
MLEDALLDLTNRGDIVLGPLLGSGSSVITSEQTGRICRGVELDPLYVDIILRRYKAVTGVEATYVETGECFADLAARRQEEAESIAMAVGSQRPRAQPLFGHMTMSSLVEAVETV